MKLTKDLIARAERYARVTGFALTTVSKRLFRDARRIEQLRERPGSVELDTLAQAEARLIALEQDLPAADRAELRALAEAEAAP